MPKLLSRSKHEEFESNSSMQIKDQKERIVENARKLELQEIWQAAKQILAGCEIPFSLPLFTALAIVHPALLNSYCPFVLFTFLLLFGFLPILPPL